MSYPTQNIELCAKDEEIAQLKERIRVMLVVCVVIIVLGLIFIFLPFAGIHVPR